MSKKATYLVTLYMIIKNRVMDLANKEADVTDEIYDDICNQAFRDVSNSFKVDESTIRDKASLRRTGIKTPVLKDMIKDYLTGRSTSFENLVKGLLSKHDNLVVVLLILRTI